jgi:hypothetical protein
MLDYQPRYVFDNAADFGLDWFEFSSLVAAALSRLMGCTRVVYLAHDASACGDCRACTPRSDGSFVILPPDDAEGEEYPLHRARIDAYLEKIAMPAEWVTPSRADVWLASEARREADRLAAALEQTRSERDSANVERLRMSGALAEAATRETQLLEALSLRDERIAALLASASWRWTAPLRWAKRMLTGTS